MAQRRRYARPGTWHHVFNRGIGKRILFANRVDYRKFTALMACAVRRGEIEVHAHSLLGTHFHLLVRIPEGGDLSRAMMRIQNAYARWFNRRNRRDGPLFRGRFRSKPVRSTAYWLTLLRYIDFNPVSAGVCDHPASYEFGSAYAYYVGRPPPWLSTGHARALFVGRYGHPDLLSGYRALLGRSPSAEERDLIECRLSGTDAEDATDDLLASSTESFQRWIIWKARNADGLKPSLPLASPDALERELEEQRSAIGPLRIQRSRKRLDAWLVLQAGLLHELTGCSCERIARRLGSTNGTVSRWVRLHRALLCEDSDYARLAAEVSRVSLARSHGMVGR